MVEKKKFASEEVRIKMSFEFKSFMICELNARWIAKKTIKW